MLTLLPTMATSTLSNMVVGFNYWPTAQPTLFSVLEMFIGIAFVLGVLWIIYKFFK